jgi:hypothetical protein
VINVQQNIRCITCSVRSLIDLEQMKMKFIKNLVLTAVATTFVVIVGCTSSCSCKYSSVSAVPPGPPVATPATVTDQSICTEACGNLRSLGCAEGKPIDMRTSCTTSADCLDLSNKPDPMQTCLYHKCTVTCETFCIDTENQGVWLDPACVKTIKSCKQIDQCPAPAQQSKQSHAVQDAG